MKDYNGFSPTERMRSWEIQKRLLQNKEISWQDKSCEICGGSGGLMMPHLEDYSNPKNFYPLCVECHMKLHNRFSRPLIWIKLLCDVKTGYIPVQWESVSAYMDEGKKFKNELLEDYKEINPSDLGDKWFHKLKLEKINLNKNIENKLDI